MVMAASLRKKKKKKGRGGPDPTLLPRELGGEHGSTEKALSLGK